jgi:hypothetical protein
VAAAASFGIGLYFLLAEGGLADAVFATAVTLGVAATIVCLGRKILLSAVLVVAIVGIVRAISSAKQQASEVILHAYDLVTFLSSWSSLHEAWSKHRSMVIGLAVAALAAVTVGWISVRFDGTRVPRRYAACDMRRSKMKPTVRRFHQLPYRAREWSRSRKVVARVEATPMGTDVRFIVTSLEGRGKTLYERVFCARGAAENLIKDMKRWTRSDKTACSRWQANQFRLFLHVGAYWLLHSLRRAAPKRSRWSGATFETIRRTFVKIAVRVEELKGRIKLAFPASYPQAAMLAAMTGAITTRGP